jgi:hypothetical protein
MKKEKLIDRFLSIPKDLRWEELSSVLSSLGFEEIKRNGKTAGARRKFANKDKRIISVHKPHPANIVKEYMIRQVIENLKEGGYI